MNNTHLFNEISAWFLLAAFTVFFGSCSEKAPAVAEKSLQKDWLIISSADAGLDGKAISSSAIEESQWVKATVPSTVLGALVDAGVYKDPFYGKNMEKISGEPFKVPWWYRKTFDLDNFNPQTETVRLFIDGINYRANIWLNGVQIASQDTLFGAFRQFELNVTGVAKAKGNILALEIIPPRVRDFYMGFVDWAPTPPDHYMGVYREIRLKRSGKVSIDAPFVITDVNTDNLKEADLSISALVTNYEDVPKDVVIKGRAEKIAFKKTVKLKPKETKWVHFPRIHVKDPRLWWPNGLGSPEMYTLDLEALSDKTVVDRQQVHFGIREVETYLNENNVRGYKVNGRKVLIKSGGWVDDLFLRYRPEKDAAQIRYVKEMNMNSIRFEGFWGNSQHIYDLCDENGILMMVGFSCQWEWPDYLGLDMTVAEDDNNLPINEGVDLYAVKYTPEEEELLSDYFKDQVLWLRNHPSIFTWAVGSDAMPKPSLERKYLNTLKQYDPTRSCLISAGKFTSELTGPSGMKMNGPYEYVPPVYWYEDQKLGGAFGFNSETGPGPQIPPLESLKKMMPEKDLWPPANDMWNFHSGRKEFNSVSVYLEALNKRYGKPEDIEELAMKAQLMNYEAIRPMFEAFVVNRPVATGVVQWMLNSPWPELYWQLYDYYLMPTGAYFGTMKACQPLNAIYNYYDHKIYASNDTRQDMKGVQVEAALFDIHSKKVFEFNKPIDLNENTVVSLAAVPIPAHTRSVYFLDLKLRDMNGKVIAGNFYWLASKDDKMNWAQYFWYYTPIKEFADYTAINTMDKTEIKASKKIVKEGEEWEIALNLKNESGKISFFNELDLAGKKSGQSILPVFWSDNYVSLLPGEQKTITVKFYGKDLGDDTPVIRINGVNLKEKIVL